MIFKNTRGQATTELVMMLPFMFAAIAIACVVFYACWQGLKTQQAANYAARIHGQERVNGGTSVQNQIEPTNGWGTSATNCLGGSGQTSSQNIQNCQQQQQSQLNAGGGSVFKAAQNSILTLFTPREKQSVLLERSHVGVISDEITVTRTFDMGHREIFGITIRSFSIASKAYGGEDSNMYGLPRWANRWAQIQRDAHEYYCGRIPLNSPNTPPNPAVSDPENFGKGLREGDLSC